MEADLTPGVLKPVTEKDVVYSPPFPRLAVTRCLPLQPTGVLATGKSHTCPSLTQFLASRKGTPHQSFRAHSFPQDGIAFEVEAGGRK